MDKPETVVHGIAWRSCLALAENMNEQVCMNCGKNTVLLEKMIDNHVENAFI